MPKDQAACVAAFLHNRPSPAGGSPARRCDLKIVVSLPDQHNEFQVLQASDARETARRLGLEIEILDAESSLVLQIQQLIRSLHARPRPDAVVVEPLTDSGMDKIARKVVAEGIGLAVLNCTLPTLGALREERPGLAIFSVCSDQVEIGRVQGRQLRALLPAGGHVLYIHGPLDATAARERYRGVTEELTGSEVRLTVIDARWSETSAADAVRRWVRLRSTGGAHVDVIAAQDDSMARGARLAVEDASGGREWSNVRYLGIDGVPEVGQRLVDRGELTATVVMPSNTGAALEMLARAQTGASSVVSLELRAASYPSEASLERIAIRGQRSA